MAYWKRNSCKQMEKGGGDSMLKIKEKNAKALIVLTGGKFNKIHPGHIELLRYAKSLGKLIVVLANDKNNDRHYALPSATRRKNIEKLKIADKIVIGDTRNFFAYL